MKLLYFSCILVLLASCSASGNDAQPSETNRIIVDVRTPDEWATGHASCSVNIPLDELPNHLEELRPYDKVILVCHSGKRAQMAQNFLVRQGFTNTENMGSWTNVRCDEEH